MVLYLLECRVDPFDSSWCLGWLVLDDVEPGLDLFPVGCFALLPYATCFRWNQGLVLCGQIGCSSLRSPRVLLEEVLLSDRNPISKTPCTLVGRALVQDEVFDLGDVGAPCSKPDVRDVGQWKCPELVVPPEVILQLQSICDQAVGSPRGPPIRCLVHDGIVHRVSIEHGGIWGEDLPVELGTEHGALEMLWMIVPVPHQDELPGRSLYECQDACQNL